MVFIVECQDNRSKLKMEHQSALSLKYYSVKSAFIRNVVTLELWQGIRRFGSDADKSTLRNEATIRLVLLRFGN